MSKIRAELDAEIKIRLGGILSGEGDTDPGVLSLSRGKNLGPLSISAAKKVVDRIRPTTQKLWNFDTRLSPTFDALPEDMKDAIAKYGQDTKAKGVVHKGMVHIVGTRMPRKPTRSSHLFTDSSTARIRMDVTRRVDAGSRRICD